MKKIHIEGVEILYTSKNEIPSESTDIIHTPQKIRGFKVEHLYNNSDMRQILVQGTLTKSLSSYFLFWSSSKNLDDLDQQVLESRVDDADFVDAAITEYGFAICANCGWVGNVLAVPVDTPNVLLNRVLILRVKAIKSFKSCPVCEQQKLSSAVLKIF